MPSDNAVFWRELSARDREVHAEEASRSLALENEQLRLHSAELTAALVQAREALTVNHQLLNQARETLALNQRLIEDQSVAIAERDRAIGDAERRALHAQHTLESVLTSRRWRAGEAVSKAVHAPRAVLGRLRRAR